jgi:hypothetical protein
MATMKKKSLIKSFSLPTVALALSVSYSSLAKADTVKSEILFNSPKNQVNHQLWGQLAEDFGVCQVAQITSAIKESTVSKNTNAYNESASAQNLAHQTSANKSNIETSLLCQSH